MLIRKNIYSIVFISILLFLTSCGSKPVSVEKIGEYIKGDIVGYHDTMPVVRIDSKLVVCSDNSLTKVVFEIEINSKITSIYGGLGNYLFIVTEQDEGYFLSKYSFLEKEKTFRHIESFVIRYPKLVCAYYNVSNTSDNGKLLGILFTDNLSLLLCDGNGTELTTLKLQDYSNVDITTDSGDVICYSKNTITIYTVENDKIIQLLDYKLPIEGNPDHIKYVKEKDGLHPDASKAIIDGENLYQIYGNDENKIFHSKLDCDCEFISDYLLSCDDGLYLKLPTNNIDVKISDDKLKPLSFTNSNHSVNDYYLFEKKENNKSKFIVLHIDLDYTKISFYETEWLEINVIKSTYHEDEFHLNNINSGHRLFCVFDEKYRYTIDLTNIIFDNTPAMTKKFRRSRK